MHNNDEKRSHNNYIMITQNLHVICTYRFYNDFISHQFNFNTRWQTCYYYTRTLINNFVWKPFFLVIYNFYDLAIWWWCACFKYNTMQPKKRKKEALTLYHQACIDCKDIYYCKLTNIIFIHTFHMWKSFFISNIQTFLKLYCHFHIIPMTVIHQSWF